MASHVRKPSEISQEDWDSVDVPEMTDADFNRAKPFKDVFPVQYEAWKKMGSPQSPTPEQYAELERASQLQTLESPRWLMPRDGRIELEFSLPRHGVSLLRLVKQ